MRRALVPLSLLTAASCATTRDAPTRQSGTLSGHVAEVAGQAIGAAEVQAVSRAQRVSTSRAIELIASEARLARAADERGLSQRSEVLVERRAALATAVLQGFKRDAEATPPAAAELADIRREHWNELDRPEALQVVHAVALAAPEDPKRAEAKLVGDNLLSALRGARSAEDFKSRAAKVSGGGVKITIEPIGPFVKDGRLATETGGGLDLTFVNGAFALTHPLEVSPVIATPFGYHVIMLVERLPAFTVPDDVLVPIVASEVVATRATRAMAARRQRDTSPVEIARNVEELFQLIGSASQP